MNISEKWAYLAVFIGVCGHASSEFFAKLTGVAGPEVSVWRYLIGATGLVIWSLARRDTRDLITPIIGTALFFSGSVDAFHVLAADLITEDEYKQKRATLLADF